MILVLRLLPRPTPSSNRGSDPSHSPPLSPDTLFSRLRWLADGSDRSSSASRLPSTSTPPPPLPDPSGTITTLLAPDQSPGPIAVVTRYGGYEDFQRLLGMALTPLLDSGFSVDLVSDPNRPAVSLGDAGGPLRMRLLEDLTSLTGGEPLRTQWEEEKDAIEGDTEVGQSARGREMGRGAVRELNRGGMVEAFRAAAPEPPDQYPSSIPIWTVGGNGPDPDPDPFTSCYSP